MIKIHKFKENQYF